MGRKLPIGVLPGQPTDGRLSAKRLRAYLVSAAHERGVRIRCEFENVRGKDGAYVGCRGFCTNLDNCSCVYVDTTAGVGGKSRGWMYRYSTDAPAWMGAQNRWSDDIDAYVWGILGLLTAARTCASDTVVW